jgi:hypothetical protein
MCKGEIDGFKIPEPRQREKTTKGAVTVDEN